MDPGVVDTCFTESLYQVFLRSRVSILILVSCVDAMHALVTDFIFVSLHHPAVRHDSCEPLVASASFSLWVLLFRLLDRSSECVLSVTAEKVCEANLIAKLAYSEIMPVKRQ